MFLGRNIKLCSNFAQTRICIRFRKFKENEKKNRTTNFQQYFSLRIIWNLWKKVSSKLTFLEYVKKKKNCLKKGRTFFFWEKKKLCYGGPAPLNPADHGRFCPHTPSLRGLRLRGPETVLNKGGVCMSLSRTGPMK